MNRHSKSSPDLFKGIALFTPGGGLVYHIDPNKQNRWHLHLCMMLRDLLGLPEPPHFLVPCYTATVDRWLDAQTSQVRMTAEAAPAVLRYQALLNQIFNTGDLVWQAMPIKEGLCDPAILENYRRQFPQLWEPQDLIAQYHKTEPVYLKQQTEAQGSDLSQTQPQAEGYVLRLFVSGSSIATQYTLQNLHQLLEQSLRHPYTLKVVDVTRHPEQAERDQISATPTLVRVWPRPVRRIVGNLDSVDQLVGVLELY